MGKSGNKRTGSFLAFTDGWFEQNQKWLLFLLNAPVLKIWFRWVMRIRSFDLPSNVKITEIKSNRFSWGDRYIYKKGKYYLERTTDFRTHPKFGKRIYFAFRPIWWTLHFWDWLIADRFIPRLSYGFSTLTAFPASGSNSPINGQTQRAVASESWSSLQSGAGNDHTDDPAGSDNPYCRVTAAATSPNWSAMTRAIFLFDTSSLTSGATISDAVFSLRGTDKANSQGDITVHICSSAPASNSTLVDADHGTLGTTSYGSVGYSSLSTSAYTDFTLNASGIAAISKTSLTKYGVRSDWDITNSAPTWTTANLESRFGGRYANFSGTASDPKLVVTYTTSTAWTKDLNETVTVVDSISNGAGKVLSEVATLVDSITNIRVQVKTLNEIITIVETFTRSIGKVYTETVVMVDTITKSIGRSFSEVVTMAETFTKGYVKFLTEDVTISETFTKLLNGSSTIWGYPSKNSASIWGYPSKNSASWNFPNRS